jgi:hypothetical protein
VFVAELLTSPPVYITRPRSDRTCSTDPCPRKPRGKIQGGNHGGGRRRRRRRSRESSRYSWTPTAVGGEVLPHVRDARRTLCRFSYYLGYPLVGLPVQNTDRHGRGARPPATNGTICRWRAAGRTRAWCARSYSSHHRGCRGIPTSAVCGGTHGICA